MIFCSVIARNHLPYARVLAESLAGHHPETPLRVLVLDAPAATVSDSEPFRQMSPDELGLPAGEFNRRRTMYDIPELASSIRAPLLEACLARGGGPVIYLDADMLALARLDDVGELALRHGIVLSPHATVPLRYEPGAFNAEQAFLRSGTFNGGLLAVSPVASDFLKWRDQRAARDCVWAPDRELAMGQKWLSLVPALFDHVVLKDRGVNLTCHGMGDDDLGWRDGALFIGETPLRLFHFAGGFEPGAVDPAGACRVSGWWPRTPRWWPRAAERPGLVRLCEDYADRLLRSGFGEKVPSTNLTLDPVAREAYRKALIEAERDKSSEPPNPHSHGMAAFTSWLMTSPWPNGVVTRYVATVYAARPDLRAAFPQVPGADEPALMEWAAEKYGGNLPFGLPTLAATM